MKQQMAATIQTLKTDKNYFQLQIKLADSQPSNVLRRLWPTLTLQMLPAHLTSSPLAS